MDMRKGLEMERPQPGPHHEHTNRVKAVHSHGGMRYQYDSDDLQYRYRLLQSKMQELQNTVTKLTEERDKAKQKLEQSGYLYVQQSQAYAQKMQYEKEQTLHRLKLDLEQRYSEELKHTRSDLDDAVGDRDSYKYQLNELQREHKRVSERLHALGANYDATRQELDSITEQRNRLRAEVTDLRKKLQTVQEKSSGFPGSEVDLENKRLKESNAQLRERLVAMEETRQRERDHSPVKSTLSRESLGRQGSDESMGKRSKGRSRLSQSSIEEDSLLPSGLHSISITELTSLDHSSGNSQESNGQRLPLPARRNLSASATNLSDSLESRRSSSDMAVQLHSRLSNTTREKEILTRELAEARRSQAEFESLTKSLQEELEKVKDELSKSHLQQSATQEQMEMIIKQKGVMIEKSTESYEQSVQLQTQLMELRAEKTLLEKQRDAATRERDRVVTDAISLKKKLETIKSQRQKDAKDLAAMRRLRDKALQEQEEASKAVTDIKAEKQSLEAQYKKLATSLRLPASNSQKRPLTEEVSKAVEQLRGRQDEYNLLLRKLFGDENMEGVNAEDAMARVEELFQDKSSLLEEIEGLQRSVHKQNEERIFELKQAIENLYMERDGLQNRNKSLSIKANRLESEREKLRQECERLDRQCQEMNATLSSPTRIGDLWRDSLCPMWEQAWELKRVHVPLGKDGFAGFTVVGGKDQPQLPNAGAFIITSVNKGGPADGILKLGDVLESINNVELVSANHQDAVSAVKESRGSLDIILRRRKKAHAVQVGIAAAVMSLGQMTERSTEQHEFCLLTHKDGVGFQYDWEAYYTLTGITEGGPAEGILRTGDRIIKVGSIPVNKEKPSQVKKLLKPHKGVLRLTIERKVEPKEGNYLTTEPPPLPVTEVLTPTKSASGSSDRSSYVKPVESTFGTDGFTHSGQESTISGHSATTQDSVNSAMPEKLGAATNSRQDGRQYVMDGARPVSDGVVYGFNDRREGFDEDYMDSEPHSTGYSASESFLSEPCSYDCLPMDSSQTSIELTFHSISQVSHNRLTVQSTMSTQPEVKEKHLVHEPYFDRDDEARTTFRSRALSADGQRFGTSSQLPEQDTRKRVPHKHSKTRRLLLGGRKHSKSGSLSQLPSIDTEECRDYTSSRKKSRSKSMIAIHGRSRSNVSLSTAPSMSSVREEPYRSMSTTSISTVNDPLADATYIRANFSYIPRHPKELTIEPGNVFHIFEDGPPERHRRSFWVSRLNADGSDAGVGAIPNTARAQEWLDEQGQAVEVAVYEEVEPYTGMQPVLICGVLANQITALLAEGYPKLFHLCQSELVESTARITEARLNREQSEGKIINYQRVGDRGYRVISYDAINCKEAKGKHVLLTGSGLVLHALKNIAPPISILVKAGAEDSIRTFGPEPVSREEAQLMYQEARDIEEQYSKEITCSLMLVFEDTLLSQITDIVQAETQKQVWVPVQRVPQLLT